jgi:hypothetical protein
MFVGLILEWIFYRKRPRGERRLSDPDPVYPMWLRTSLIVILVVFCAEVVLA